MTSYRGGLAGGCCRSGSFWFGVCGSLHFVFSSHLFLMRICQWSLRISWLFCSYIYHLTIGGFALTFPLDRTEKNDYNYQLSDQGSEWTKINLRATVYRWMIWSYYSSGSWNRSLIFMIVSANIFFSYLPFKYQFSFLSTH